jgi:hypothetical protein
MIRIELPAPVARTITFLAVVIAWVLFRADSFTAAGTMLTAMFGGNGISLFSGLAGRFGDFEPALLSLGLRFDGVFHNSVVVWQKFELFNLAILLVIAHAMPNSLQLMARMRPVIETVPAVRFAWAPNIGWSAVIASFAVLSLMGLSRVNKFLYFQF